jgi:hypothetical protein
MSMTISPSTIAPGGTATLTITFGNANVPAALLTPFQWSRQCTNENCFGVPMYRQNLVKGESTAGAIRLAGQDTWNRSALTPNNGIFYVDTTRGLATQQAWSNAANINVFQPNTKYYLFTLFAKPTTSQTYQVYVGKPFDPNTDVWATRASTNGVPVEFANPLAWPPGWGRSYDSNSGVLTVTMNMGFPGFATDYNKAFKDNCQPRSFCTWEGRTDPLHPERGGTCSCNMSGPFSGVCADKNTAGEDVCAWSQKDVDCPNGGCFGFGFKTGATFVYNPAPSPRPSPSCLKPNSAWNVTYIDAAPGLAGAAPICTNAPKLVPPKFCE